MIVLSDALSMTEINVVISVFTAITVFTMITELTLTTWRSRPFAFLFLGAGEEKGSGDPQRRYDTSAPLLSWQVKKDHDVTPITRIPCM